MPDRKKKRNSHIIKAVLYGALTAALYAAVFTHADTVLAYCSRGAWFAALPIATVFVFSFVHGAFANYLWAALGIEATKKAVQPRVAERPAPRKRPRPRLHLNT